MEKYPNNPRVRKTDYIITLGALIDIDRSLEDFYWNVYIR